MPVRTASLFSCTKACVVQAAFSQPFFVLFLCEIKQTLKSHTQKNRDDYDFINTHLF